MEAADAAWAEMSDEERASILERAAASRERDAAREAELRESLRWAHEHGSPKVLISCSFAEAMGPREQFSLAKQAQMAYMFLRDQRSELQLHLTSVGPANPVLPFLEDLGFRKWLVHCQQAPYWELFDRSRIVVLSPDADEDLEELSREDIYVIGGLVDRFVLKGTVRRQAEEHGATRLRRLPLRRYGPRGAHPVLNVDCVVRILARMAQPASDWRAVLADCLPTRHARRLGEGGGAGSARSADGREEAQEPQRAPR